MEAERFYQLFERLCQALHDGEVLAAGLSGEDSSFVRFNKNRVRQAGAVQQATLSLDLIAGQRHATGTCEIDPAGEAPRELIEELRAQRAHLPDDPYLAYATEPHNTDERREGELPEADDAIDTIVRSAEGMDLVGVWAAGSQFEGFANSLGQRNWHSIATFNFDWSVHHAGDKAVKAQYAGEHFDPAALAAKMDATREALDRMAQPARTIEPGRYRVYLAPGALAEIMDVLAWEAFGLKSHRTAQTPLIKMVREGRTLSPLVRLVEDHAGGLAPRFTEEGFIKSDRIELIIDGHYRDTLVSPRSAREYGVALNSGSESPESLDMAAGDMPQAEVLERLERGVYINNLWYANYSDPNNARITGMTRFACFWVEDGRIQAPLNVMRFDDSIYRMLGECLEALTVERELIIDSDTYGGRSHRTYRLPGALLSEFNFAL